MHSSEKLLNSEETRRGDDLASVLRHNGMEPLNMKRAAGSRDNGVLDNAAELLKLFTHQDYGCVFCSVCREQLAMRPCLEALFDPLPEPQEQPLCYVWLPRQLLGVAGGAQGVGPAEIRQAALGPH